MYRQIIKLFEWTRANDRESFVDGLFWYSREHQWGVDLAKASGYSVSQVLGAAAILSPRIGWDVTKQATAMLVHEDRTGLGPTAPFPRNIEKARFFLEGETFETLVRENKSPKVFNFFHNLRWPRGDWHSVTLDTWMFALHGREDGKAHWAKYRSWADEYRRAGRRLGVEPSRVQAVLWTAMHRETLPVNVSWRTARQTDLEEVPF